MRCCLFFGAVLGRSSGSTISSFFALGAFYGFARGGASLEDSRGNGAARLLSRCLGASSWGHFLFKTKGFLTFPEQQGPAAEGSTSGSEQRQRAAAAAAAASSSRKSSSRESSRLISFFLLSKADLRLSLQTPFPFIVKAGFGLTSEVK